MEVEKHEDGMIDLTMSAEEAVSLYNAIDLSAGRPDKHHVLENFQVAVAIAREMDSGSFSKNIL